MVYVVYLTINDDQIDKNVPDRICNANYEHCLNPFAMMISYGHSNWAVVECLFKEKDNRYTFSTIRNVLLFFNHLKLF